MKQRFPGQMVAACFIECKVNAKKKTITKKKYKI